VQYPDYAVWQRQWVDGEALVAQAEYWKATLAGAPEVLGLPTDRPRSAEWDYAGDLVPIELDAELAARIRALSRREGVTVFQTLLTGWAAVLARLSRQSDVVIGTPIANRPLTELEGVIGYFVNLVAVRLDLSRPQTVTELLHHVRAQALAAQEHESLPFGRVVELVAPPRTLAHHPVFQAMFAMQAAATEQLRLPGFRVESLERAAHLTARCDLSLGLQEVEDGRIVGVLEYATSLFDRATAERYADYLRVLLAGMADAAGHRT
jgi:non-ribosomal peptide synthetase component F